MDWEAWLKAAAAPPSDNEDSKRENTEEEILDALNTYGPLQGRPWCVYAKGSYANNTNVRLNYDVDIAVEYRGFFYSDLCFELEDQPKSVVGVYDSSDPYTRDEFKRDIKSALITAFGSSAISTGRIAYRVREKKTTLPADVVPCWEYRRYDRIRNGVPIYQEGSRVYPSDGGHKNNFPKKQLLRGQGKNNRTGRRYKRMVRALKKLQTKLVSEGKLREELASYLTECLVYNVPDDSFNHTTYLADMRAVLATIYNATLSTGDSNDWHEVHELTYLFRASQWTPSEVHRMADAAWNAMGFD
jgi:hypothetical protein